MNEMIEPVKLPYGFEMAKPLKNGLEVEKRFSLLSNNKIKTISGVYIWVLKEGAKLPQLSNMVEPCYTKVLYKGDEYRVIYVGRTDNLSKRLNSEHYKGRVQWSTLRYSLAVLLGFSVERNDKEIILDKEKEDVITNWLYDNCMVIFHYYTHEVNKEKKFITLLDPPLNIDDSPKVRNIKYLKQLSELRNI